MRRIELPVLPGLRLGMRRREVSVLPVVKVGNEAQRGVCSPALGGNEAQRGVPFLPF